MIDISKLNKNSLAKMLDHTFLKAYATEQDFIKLCTEAKENHFAMVAINSYPVKLCKKLLQDSDVRVGAAIGFPLGQTTIKSKCFETKNAIENGADEIDYVINIGKVKESDYDYIEEEMKQLVQICKENNVLIKAIFENCYLTKEEIINVALIAKKIRPDFIKTSTGFGSSGAKVEDVKLMKETVGNLVKVKAAGGIRDWKTCKEMIMAGAERIGTSSSLVILDEYSNNHE